ncbi:MAG TPA: hypothetical protein VF649_07450 [Sphingomonas sp.]|jgi:preprotein translocase subunit YajC|uniref:hypothetical protein n=1 Tax=Sphingomonas sp. TaxID=28214 RepID=UPI002EDB2521
MKTFILIAGAALMASGAQAQTAATTAPTASSAASKVTTGATVTDTAGGTVGTIKSVDAGFAVLSTGTVEVRLPLSSFANGASGPVIAMTKAQVESAASGATAERQAKLAAQITAGTTVMDQQGGTVGKIESVDGQFATVATANNKVKLPVSAFAAGESGPVIGMTAAQLDAAAAAAAPAPAADAPKTAK